MAHKVDSMTNVEPGIVTVYVGLVRLTPDETRQLAFQLVQAASKAEEMSPIVLPGRGFPQ